jgi:hypothetical protein
MYVNAKMKPVETFPGMGESNGSELKYDIFDKV